MHYGIKNDSLSSCKTIPSLWEIAPIDWGEAPIDFGLFSKCRRLISGNNYLEPICAKFSKISLF